LDRREILLMVERKKKMEIQGLLSTSFDFVARTYLPKKFANQSWLEA